MKKALHIYSDRIYEMLALLMYKVFLLGIFFLFSIGVFVVANTFIKLPLWIGLILFAILAAGVLLSYFKQTYLLTVKKRISLDDFTFDSFVLAIRAIPLLLLHVVVLALVMLPVGLIAYYFPSTLENSVILLLYGIYFLFAAFIIGYLLIWPYLWISIFDTNPIVALQQGVQFGLKHTELFQPYAIWFVAFLTLFVPLLNLLTYFTLYPAATINLLLSLKSVSMGKRMPL
ncbi:MAG: hypothetical protein GXN92_00605 [Candidatus Micrarchaeota archaeon]|nr:hypothetical protein [Candidatus Micrarchaeota archaeon]